MHLKPEKIVSFGLLAAFLFVAISCFAETADEAKVVTDKNEYALGEKIRVSYSGAPGNRGDWVTIVPTTMPDMAAGEVYKYTPRGESAGVMEFDPLPPGEYEVRAYYNYSPKDRLVTARHPITVGFANPGDARAYYSRKLDPAKPGEANAPADSAVVYIYREFWKATEMVTPLIEIKGHSTLNLENNQYGVVMVKGGPVEFSSSRGERIDYATGVSDTIVPANTAKLAIQTEPGFAYYVKIWIPFSPGMPFILDQVAPKEGEDYITSSGMDLVE